MTEEIIGITINTKANLKGINQTVQGFQKMREMGEKISQIGTRISAVFTAPIVGLGALLLKNEQLAASLQPIKDAFSGVIADLAQGLIPVVKDLTPAILDIVKGIKGLVDQFNALSTGQKENILKWVGLAALLGPVIFGIGQLISFVGTLGLVFNATLAPILAVGAALYALYTLINMDEFKQVVALLAGNTIATLTGNDKTKGALATQKTYQALGGGAPGGEDTANFVKNIFGTNAPAAAGTGSQFVFNYSPAISTASSAEVQKQLAPIIADVLRQQTGRK